MSSENPQEAKLSEDLAKMIVNEVDEAREVLELTRQLAHAIPIRSFDDALRAVGKRGVVTFRGRELALEKFRPFIASFLYPIDTVEKLVVLLYEAVRRAPKNATYSEKDPAYAKINLRRQAILGLPVGIPDPFRPGAPVKPPGH